MDLMFETDEYRRVICTLVDAAHSATVTASNVPEAAEDLQDALASAASSGLGECFWQEQAGVYRWLFRRQGARVEVVVLWSTGVITGWEHVFRSECDLAWLTQRVGEEVARRQGPS